MSACDGVAGDDAFEGGLVRNTAPNVEAHAVCRMPGRCDDLDLGGDALYGDDLAINQWFGITAVGFVDAANGGASELPETQCAVGVVMVTVRQQNQCCFVGL